MSENLNEEVGNISVHTENLFPIIKKWLYSEPDIFLRELVSNAHDAITKLERLIDTGNSKVKLGKPLINIKIDKPNKTLTICDNGLGMTAEEIKKYINQIAFSGAEEFVKKYESAEEGKNIIGHFGMGFFSAFMVADKVEINTLSHTEGATPAKWSCEGKTSFKISPSDKSEVGTDIILHINDESETYLDESTITDLVKRYSNFIPIEVQVNNKTTNEQSAIWQKKANQLKKEDYVEFYQKLYPMDGEPLFYVHLDVDFPFKLKGVLYFPKIRNDLEINQKGRIKLFCNNVFVSDNVADFIPQYLTLLQGVLDSPDIPLNVSRSTLQNDQNVKKIASHIIKKITEKLKEIFKEDRKTYEECWRDIHPFIKFGVMSDGDFFDKIKDHIIFESTAGKFLTLKEYQEENSKLKDKVIYTSDSQKQKLFIDKITNENVSVVMLNSPVDNHFLQHYEMKVLPTRFVRVDSDSPERLLSIEESNTDTEKKDDKKESPYKDQIELVKKHIPNTEITVEFSAMKEADVPSILVFNEQMRRFQDMSTMFAQKNQAQMNELAFATLVLNTNNTLVKRIITGDAKDMSIKPLCEHLYDLALLQQGKLSGASMVNFTKRSSKLIADSLEKGITLTTSPIEEKEEKTNSTTTTKASKSKDEAKPSPESKSKKQSGEEATKKAKSKK